MANLSLTHERASHIINALREVLPADRFDAHAGLGLGYDGVMVELVGADLDTPGAGWYFDTTYGGADGHTAELRAYFTSSGEDPEWDDIHPLGPPLLTTPAVDIARWIASVVRS